MGGTAVGAINVARATAENDHQAKIQKLRFPAKQQRQRRRTPLGPLQEQARQLQQPARTVKGTKEASAEAAEGEGGEKVFGSLPAVLVAGEKPAGAPCLTI